MLAIRVFDRADPTTERFALALGEALQLTNILRDIDEDAALGRLYLPREGLSAAGIASDDPRVVAADPRIAKVCADLVRQARAHFEASDAIMARNPRRTVRAPRIMSAYYHAILDKLVARGFAPPRAPVKLGKAAKIFILLRHAII